MKLRTRNASRERGYTLIELAIAMGIVGLVLGSLTSVFESSGSAYQQGAATANAQTLARRAAGRIAQELENAGFSTLLPNPVGVSCDDLVYQIATGIDAATSTITYDDSSRLRFVYEAGEVDNGVDDDGDGLVDEGCIELTRNYLLAGEVVVILAKGIPELSEGELANGADDNGNGLSDERGFSLTRVGNLMRLRISVASPIPGADPAVATVDTALRLKN